MKEYSMELCGVKRTLPFIPISEEMAFASFVVLGDTELVSACAPELAAKIGEVDAIVTAEAKGEQHLCLDGKDADKIRGKRVCLLDDVISTGESLHALECLMANASAEVVKKAAILAEGDAADRKDIVFLQKLPLFKKTGDGEYEVIE